MGQVQVLLYSDQKVFSVCRQVEPAWSAQTRWVAPKAPQSRYLPGANLRMRPIGVGEA